MPNHRGVGGIVEKIKLLYFEGCPEAKHARAALLTAGIDSFEAVLQDELDKDDPLKSYSSPTILKGNEIIYGSKLSEGSSACSYQKIDPAKIHAQLKNSSSESPKNFKKPGFLSAIGALGSGIAVGLCPLCIPAIGAFLASIGLGFVAQDKVLRLALVLMLLATIAGFFWSYLKKHGNIWPFLLGILFSASMYAGRYFYLGSEINFALMYGSIPALIGVALWNLYLSKKTRDCGGCVK